MKKILLFTSVSILLSACGGGGGGDKDSASAQLTRSNLEISEKSLGSNRSTRSGGTIMKGDRSSTNTYDPDYTVRMDSAKIAGNSKIKFGDDGTITLDVETCITNDDDCGAIRAAVLKDGTVKIVENGRTEPINAREKLYSRGKLVISDNQKLTQSVARNNFGTLADVFNFYAIDSNKLKSGDRSSLDGAKLVNIVDDNRDSFHDPESASYWTNSGVKETIGDKKGKSRVRIFAVVSKKGGSFASYAQLGIISQHVKLSDGRSGNLDFANVDGEYTTAANLHRVGATYSKNKGWHAMGAINNKLAYMQGNVDIKIDVNTNRITEFNVENMTYQNMNQGKLGGSVNFLSGKKLQLANNTALSYNADGEYTGTLTENGGATGQNDKWDTTLKGNFFGPEAQETAGAITMQKNGNIQQNILTGGFAAKKE